MGKKSECLLSAAMIVRDEELNIRRVLESLKDVVDEIVIVDTGSEDSTVKIANEYTDKVYFYEWNNNFSEARNFSLKFASCKWILVIDADEEVSNEFASNIREFLEELSDEYNTVYVTVIDFYDLARKKKGMYSMPRIFRNGTVRYVKAVHNQPIFSERVATFPFPIFHYGYILSASLVEKKYQRSKPLIVKEINTTKDELLKLYYLCQLLRIEYFAGKYHEARKLVDQIIPLSFEMPPDKLPTLIIDALIIACELLSDLSEMDVKKKILKRLIEIAPDHPDAYYLLAEFEVSNNEEKASKLLRRFIKKYENYMRNPAKFSWYVSGINLIQSAYLLLGAVELKKERLDEFFKYVRNALKVPASFRSKFGIDKILSIMKDLRREYLMKALKAIPLLMSIAKEIGYHPPYFKHLLISALEKELTLDLDLPKEIELSTVERKLLRRLRGEKEEFFEVLFSEKRPQDCVMEYQEDGLLFVFEIYTLASRSMRDYKRLLRFLRDVEINEAYSKNIRYLATMLIGDVFLKLSNLNEAVLHYKKAFQNLPSLAGMLQYPLMEIAGASSLNAIKYTAFEYLRKSKLVLRDFFVDIENVVSKELREVLYLLSDLDVAKYISALALEKLDPEKAGRLLDELSENSREQFPLYWYRKAEICKRLKRFEESIKLYERAFEKHPFLADIVGNGEHVYRGVYPENRINTKGDIVSVVNVSEFYETFGVINPLKIWRKMAVGYLYAESIPEKDVMVSLMSKMLERGILANMLGYSPKDLFFPIYKSEACEISIEPTFISEILKKWLYAKVKEIDIHFSKSAKTSLVFSDFIGDDDLRIRVKDYEKAIVIQTWDSSLSEEILASPLRYFLRSPFYLECLMQKVGFRKVLLESLGRSSWVMVLERREAR